MPATHVFVPVDPLDDDEEPPDEEPPDEEPPEDDEPPDDEDVLPQKVFAERPHATSALLHAPSTHAAARYESPLSQSQHVGLQSAYVEHDPPVDRVPLSFSGFDGQPPFTCSACDDTVDDDDEEPDDPDDELA